MLCGKLGARSGMLRLRVAQVGCVPARRRGVCFLNGSQYKRAIYRQLKLGHRRAGEELPTGARHQAGPSCRAADARAVGGDAGIRVHLAVNLGDKDKGQPRL